MEHSFGNGPFLSGLLAARSHCHSQSTENRCRKHKWRLTRCFGGDNATIKASWEKLQVEFERHILETWNLILPCAIRSLLSRHRILKMSLTQEETNTHHESSLRLTKIT